ncbi:MAG TPA: hypothetical protein VF600_08715 [Abditibacteriaceae bacterium]
MTEVIRVLGPDVSRFAFVQVQNWVIGEKVREFDEAARQDARLSAARPDEDASAAPNLT